MTVPICKIRQRIVKGMCVGGGGGGWGKQAENSPKHRSFYAKFPHVIWGGEG